MNQPEFPTVFRGYDPVQVDQHVAALQQAADAARQEAAASTVELTKLRQSHEQLSSELDDQRRSLSELEEQARKVSSPTFADLGERIGAMLGLADEEAGAIRAAAADDVEQARRAADDDAALVRAEADRYAEELRNRAEVEASQAVARAKQEADSIIDDAAREAAARREEAEAYYEKQRATAAASAADFERTLGERRERSAAEFTAQMAQQDQALAAVQERADLLGREAEEDRRTAAAESARALEAARAEAAALVGSAREQADRIRRDSERELAAATARRDSITAQLSNVRNMLATLGGGAPVALPEQEAPAAQQAEAGHDEAPTQEQVESEVHDEAEVEAPEGAEAAVDATDEGAGEVEAVDGELSRSQRASRSRRRPRRTRRTPAAEPVTPKGPITNRGGALRHPQKCLADRAADRGVTTCPAPAWISGTSRPLDLSQLQGSRSRGHDMPGAGLDLGHVSTARPATTRSGPSRPASEQGQDGVPDGVRHDQLGCRADLGRVVGPPPQQVHRAVVVPEGLVGADLVDDEQVAALAGELGAGVVEHRPLGIPGLGREAHDDRHPAAPPGRDQPGEHVGVAHQLDDRSRLVGRAVGAGCVRLLDLGAGVDAGRKSATAAAMTTTSVSRTASVTAACSSSAVSTGTTVTPSGTGSDDDETSTTSAPRSAAARARAYPCLPELRLPR